MQIEVESHPNLVELSISAAKHFVRLAEEAISERGRFSVVLAGGSTPRKLYETLAEQYRDKLPWENIYFFWGDERLVPADDPDSNFKLAHDTLLNQMPIPSKNIYPMTLHPLAPDKAAAEYERQLRDFFGAHDSSFDLVLLGMGEDGHTASLFPEDSDVLMEREKWVAGVIAPDYRPPPERITLTFPIINQARNVFFLVAGESKREVLRKILNGEDSKSEYPAGRVSALNSLRWFVDYAAMGERD